MDSRAEGGPPAVFHWFFEAACPASLQEDPPLLWQFPPDFRDQEATQMVPRFCFPFDVEREPPGPVQHFTFALTDLAGNRKLGFCRLRAGARSCLCILSCLPWFEIFYKLLNTVGDLLAQGQVCEAEGLLRNLQQQPLTPGPRGSPGLDLLPCFVAPDSGRLPSIPENRNLTELVVAVTEENIVGLFAALLAERRVLLTASKLSTLTACVHASCALLYPLRWQHVLIPTLPPSLLDYCCAPMPYVIGVHASLVERVRDKALEDVVVMNVDANTLETPFRDVQALPPDVVSLLRLQLRKVALSPGEGVSRLFLRAQALLFGGYRDALVCSPGRPVTFSEEAFLAQKPGAPLQAFRRRAVHLQLFRQFIDARLQVLNAGQGLEDPFEQEAASLGTPHAYQLWADSLKKGGGALLNSVKAKTQPAARNVYRAAKSGFKGMQHLLMYKDSDSGLQRGGSLRTPSLASRSDRLQQRLPITQHFGQNRPLRPGRRPKLEGGLSEPLGERSPPGSPEDAQGPWAEAALDSSFLGSGEELDLLSEILDSLSTQTKNTEGLRSQSLECRHRGDPDSCFSLPDIRGTAGWPPDEQGPQALSLPADLALLCSTPPLEAAGPSLNPDPQLRSEANQEVTSAPLLSTAAADPSSPGAPESCPPTEPPPSIFPSLLTKRRGTPASGRALAPGSPLRPPSLAPQKVPNFQPPGRPT